MTDYFDKVAGINALRPARVVEAYGKGNRRPAVSFASVLKKAGDRRNADKLVLGVKKAS